jgi:uroporphyrinogen decarboxylase
MKVNRREALLDLLDANKKQEYIPAAFFLHFDEIYHQGEPAIDKHLEYFRYTGMDFVKIQYEITFPQMPNIKTPADWAKMPLYKEDFYEPQLKVVEGLVKKAKKEALVLVTLYSPFMCAGQTTSQETVTEHIKESPDDVKKGMEVITESLMLFVKGCIRAGVDGFYASTQGGESFRFDDSTSFNECIKPYDLTLMEEMNRSCVFNILHVCDYSGGYDDLTPFLDYPGHVVNCSLKIGSEEMTKRQASNLFGRPFMGGMERKGVIATGTEDEIRKAVEAVLHEIPDKFILGADCTVPNDTNWDNLRTAISTAHSHLKSS